ncbi:MAG: hypothetical protein KDA60_13250, partial [Planctomycetales bacterium]|nr:hypothetical protein [Planctomycetales bacterium]
MYVRCICSQCQTRFRVDAKYAGRRAKCPQCQAIVTVPAVPVAPTLDSGSAMAPHVSPPAEVSGVSPPSLDIVTDDRSPSARVRRRSMSPWAIVIIGSLGLLTVVAGGVVWLALSYLNAPGTLVLDLPDESAANLKVEIDGAAQGLPESRPAVFRLSAGPHELLVRRRGYPPFRKSIVIGTRTRLDVVTTWEMSEILGAVGADIVPRGYEGWLQSVERSVEQAQVSGKHVLVAFVGSDWHRESQELRRRVLASPEFAATLGERYVTA